MEMNFINLINSPSFTCDEMIYCHHNYWSREKVSMTVAQLFIINLNCIYPVSVDTIYQHSDDLLFVCRCVEEGW